MYQWREKAPEQNRTHKRGDKEADNNVVIASNFWAIYNTTNRLFFDATINEWTNRPCKLAAISWRFVTLKLKKNAQ